MLQRLAPSPPASAGPPYRRPRATFSESVRSGNGCATWNVRPMPARQRRWGGQVVMSRPRQRTVPAVGRI